MKMNLKNLIEKIKKTDDCIVFPPSFTPKCHHETDRLPPDLREFYSLCGGMLLFSSKEYAVKIVEPHAFALANPIIVGELCPEDRSSQWYIIANDMNDGYITIDLARERLGRCYDSFWDRHGVIGDCPIIAQSFSELLFKLFYSQGNYWYWLQEDFITIGDAYD